MGDLLQAASYGFLKLTPPQIATFVRSACRTGSATPKEIHKAIMSLGPSCFITTNYDDLLEQAYRSSRPASFEPRVVLNTQLLEQAEIVHAQARGFIFKPHGDARNTESIVLTREQYRMLLPEGPLSVTLNTFKTLLESRPVLFLGFGLRDPDFLHVRDILANIYRGGMRDHYAIVADPVRDQFDYWRAHYGIHLVGYETADEGRDHSSLITLLDQLRPTPTPPTVCSALDLQDPAAILTLARYAAGCLTPSTSERFDIRVMMVNAAQEARERASPFDYWTVERILREGPSRLILLGEPGAGKSFALRETVNTIATSLQDACLRGEHLSGYRIAIAIDLKLYEGNLESLISGKFPTGLSLERLYASFAITIYFDSYNEMPRAFREDGSFDRQLDALLESMSNLGVVIGSRNSDGLDRLGIPVCRLSEIAEEEVERRLAGDSVTLPETHQYDIVRILQRPFYFRMLDKSVMSLERIQSPGDLYAQFVDHIETRFTDAFEESFGLINALQRHAYATLANGSEAFTVSDLENAICEAAPQLSRDRVSHITNWLASEEVVIPMRGHRASFVHQSITEFLAARELKSHLERDQGGAEPLINLRTWDNALFLALGMLDESLAARVLDEIAARDITFALNAARFVQHGGDALIGQLLNIISSVPSTGLDYDAREAFRRLPFVRSHEAAIRKVLSIPELRSEAFYALAKSLGQSVKQELIELLFDDTLLYDCRSIGMALADLVQLADVPIMVDRLSRLDSETLGDEEGSTAERVSAVAAAFRGVPDSDIRQEVFNRLESSEDPSQRILAALVSEIFWSKKSSDGLVMLMELGRRRLISTLFSIYLNVRYESDFRDKFIFEFDDSMFEAIVHYIERGDHWAVELLRTVGATESITMRVFTHIDKNPGPLQPVFEYCVSEDPTVFFSLLQEWSTEWSPERRAALRMIDFSDVDWSNHEHVFVSLLSRRDLDLAGLILGGACPPDIEGLDRINLGDVEPWVNWLVELRASAGTEGKLPWAALQLAALIAHSSSENTKEQLLRLLHDGSSPQQDTVLSLIISEVEGLSIDDFSRPALDLLKNEILKGKGGNEFRPHVFSLIADPEFLYEELFPLAAQSAQANSAVALITRQVGKRLGIRLAAPPAHTDTAELGVSGTSVRTVIHRL